VADQQRGRVSHRILICRPLVLIIPESVSFVLEIAAGVRLGERDCEYVGITFRLSRNTDAVAAEEYSVAYIVNLVYAVPVRVARITVESRISLRVSFILGECAGFVVPKLLKIAARL
jgi:hypothetical protein